MAKKPHPAPGQGETVRREIVEAANRLFYHRGYNQTSFTDIAEAAGIPRGNFYYYFRSKDDILGAVIDARIERIRAMLAEWDAAEPDPRLRLKRFAQMIRGSEKDLLRYGCPMGSLNIELGKAQPALKARAKKMFDLFIDWLARQLAALGQADASRLALQAMGRVQGVAVMTQVYGDREFMRAQLAEFDAWIESLPAQGPAK
ncbi:MAG: TetR/AcrR family transcriptional regulator [Burkholderiales bacterium]|nr:TetR/AcrR family transcriptional regulator [Burkholderiales bacterium]